MIKSDEEYLKEFQNGEWVESDKIQAILNMTFSECMSKFDMSRTAEWWSIVGTTDEERKYEGQKITVSFKIKR